jgi:hypothetical protein
MAETLLEYQKLVSAPNGAKYQARARASRVRGGLWHGWMEFVPIAGGLSVRTARETTQPNRIDTVYWATGLSAVYLEGALRRALSKPTVMPALRPPRALFGGPAPIRASLVEAPRSSAVLDPFSVYREGQAQLRRELTLLSVRQLVDIAVKYDMTSLDSAVLDCLPAATLLELIVLAVVRGSARAARRGKRAVTSPTRARVVPSSTRQSDR